MKNGSFARIFAFYKVDNSIQIRHIFYATPGFYLIKTSLS